MDIREFILIYMVMFIAGCMLGYLLEVLFRHFVAKKWVNPGFMKGPWLPLYGFGLLLMFSICMICLNVLPQSWTFYNPLGNLFGKTEVHGPAIADLLVIALMTIGVILLEFIAGVIFVCGFKVRLWDYTNYKGNILGVICPVFNVIWFFICVIYYYLLNPFVFSWFESIYKFISGTSAAQIATEFTFIFFLGAIYGIFVLDLVRSLGIFNKIVELTRNNPIAIEYEKFSEVLREKNESNKEKILNMLPKTIRENASKASEEREQRKEKTTNWFKNLVLIDPNLDTSKNEYDEKGRPNKIN